MILYLIIAEMIDVNCLKDGLDAVMKFDIILDDRSSLCYQLFLTNQLHFINENLFLIPI